MGRGYRPELGGGEVKVKWTLIIWNANDEEHARYDSVRFFESSDDGRIKVILHHDTSVEVGSIQIQDGQSLQILRGTHGQISKS